METSKCWASVDTASSVSSGLTDVNVGEGCKSMESGSCNFAKVQEESPVKNKRVRQPGHTPQGSHPPRHASNTTLTFPTWGCRPLLQRQHYSVVVTRIECSPRVGGRPISSPSVRMVWRTVSIMLPELLAAWWSWLSTLSGHRLGVEGLFLGLNVRVGVTVTAYSGATVC